MTPGLKGLFMALYSSSVNRGWKNIQIQLSLVAHCAKDCGPRKRILACDFTCNCMCVLTRAMYGAIRVFTTAQGQARVQAQAQAGF